MPSWFCLKCTQTSFPYGSLEDHEFKQTLKGKKIKYVAVTKALIPTQSKLIENLNLAMDDPNKSDQFKYYETSEFKTMTSTLKDNFAVFHLNISSLSFHFDEF